MYSITISYVAVCDIETVCNLLQGPPHLWSILELADLCHC